MTTRFEPATDASSGSRLRISLMQLGDRLHWEINGRQEMPQFSFRLTAVCEVIVTADTEEQAGILAANETPISAYAFESGEMTCIVTPENESQCIRHADHVID